MTVWEFIYKVFFNDISRTAIKTILVLSLFLVGGYLGYYISEKHSKQNLDSNKVYLDRIKEQGNQISKIYKKQNNFLAEREKRIKEKETNANKNEQLISKLKNDNIQLKKILEETNSVLSSKTPEIAKLKEDCSILSKEVLELNRYRNIANQNALKLAKKIKADYFPDENENTINNWIRSFAENPGYYTAKDLQKKLVGAKRDDLEEALKSGLGFKIWLKTTIDGFDNEKWQSNYFGAKSFDEFGYTGGVLIIKMNSNNDDISRKQPMVENVKCGEFIRVVNVPNTKDWNVGQSYLLVSDFAAKEHIIDERESLASKKQWGIEDVYPFPSDMEISIDLLFGSSRRFSQITYNQLEVMHPIFCKSIMKDTCEEFADSINILKKANDFTASDITIELPQEIREVFEKLLTSTVEKKLLEIRLLLSDSVDDYNMPGKIAACVLKQNFRVVRNQPFYHQRTNSSMNVIPSLHMDNQNFSKPNLEPIGYYVFARYQKSVHNEQEIAIKFTFERSATEYGWELVDFEEMND